MGYIGRDNRVSTFTKQSITADGGTSFTLNQGVGDSSSVMVSIGGVVQQPDVAYTAAGTSLTFTSAPTNAYPIWVIYLGKELTVSSESNFDNVASQTGVGDGTTTPVTLSNSVSSVQSIIVTLNGISQVPTTDFTVSGTTLTFTTAPSAAMAILIYYIDLAVAENVVSDETVMVSSLASTGTWPAWNGSALTGVVGASDITKLHDDIALLHFLRSIDSSSKIANMIEGWSDTFPDTNSIVGGGSLHNFTNPFTRFDGTNDSLSATDAVLGNADGKSFLISFWMDFNSTARDGVTNQIYANNGNAFYMQRRIDNKLEIEFENAAGGKLYQATTTANLTYASGLTHVLLAVDLTNTTVHLYLNDAVPSLSIATAPVNDTINFAAGTFTVGAGGGAFHGGNLRQFYVAQEYLDVSVLANRRKFINADLTPVDFGTDGSTPTGTQPIIYLNNQADTFQNNLGSGGNFTESGQLVDGGYIGDKLYSSTNFSNSYELIDSNGKENNTGAGGSIVALGDPSGVNRYRAGQCFTLASPTTITSFSLLVAKTASPSGTYYFELMGTTGSVGSLVGDSNLLQRIDMGNISALTTTPTLKTATITPTYLPAGSYYIGAYNANGDGSNYLNLYQDITPSHAGNVAFDNHSGGWAVVTTSDVIFYLYGSKNFTLTTKGSDSLTATSPATAPTKGYFQALISENPVSGTTELTRTLNTDSSSTDTGWRVVISNTELTNSAGKVRVTLQASTATDKCAIDNVAIVERVGSTSDGVTTPKEILFGGTSGVIIPVGSSITSDWTAFDLDASKDYLVIIDQSTSGGNYIRYGTSGGHGYYTKAATNSYSTASYPAAGTLNYSASRSAIVTKLETEVQQTINTDYIGEMSRDGGTTYSPAVLSRVTDVVAGSADRIVQGDVSFTGDPSGTNMVGRIRTVNKDKVTVKAMGINWD